LELSSPSIPLSTTGGQAKGGGVFSSSLGWRTEEGDNLEVTINVIPSDGV